MNEHATVLRPGRRASDMPGLSSALPADLLGQAASRLRVMALVYALTFFLAGLFPVLVVPSDRVRFFSSAMLWGPTVVAIVAGLVVAALIGSPRVPLSRVMTMGLVFEVAGSYGIAAVEFGEPITGSMHGHVMGLSWVGVWTVLFTIVVPTSPRRTLLAALASVSSVPVVAGLMIASGTWTFRPDPAQFFFWLVFPYILIAGMALVGSRVVYALGAEVKRARELGSYQLEEKLGEGGMGEVWRARHRMLARPAAIKLIRASVAAQTRTGLASEALRRFEREAQAIAQLRSPHTVELFDFGVAADGVMYYVMELLDGLDADTLVKRFGPVPPERAIHLLRQICHSLSEAESRGLVHRDVKPANIFLCRYGEEFDFVKVLDFGIVKASLDTGSGGVTETAEHAVNGTPAFMAPEQALGAAIDGRADIYAAGCVAYWLLTGQFVFTAENAVGVLMHHVRTPPPSLSSRAFQKIPSELEDLVMSCLAKEPSERPHSARELSRRLGELQGAGAWTHDRAREWWAENLPKS